MCDRMDYNRTLSKNAVDKHNCSLTVRGCRSTMSVADGSCNAGRNIDSLIPGSCVVEHNTSGTQNSINLQTSKCNDLPLPLASWTKTHRELMPSNDEQNRFMSAWLKQMCPFPSAQFLDRALKRIYQHILGGPVFVIFQSSLESKRSVLSEVDIGCNFLSYGIVIKNMELFVSFFCFWSFHL